MYCKKKMSAFTEIFARIKIAIFDLYIQEQGWARTNSGKKKKEVLALNNFKNCLNEPVCI